MSSARYRVALIITELDVGGAERCLAHLACGLDQGQFETVVYALGSRPVEDQLVVQLEDAGVPVRFVGAGSVWQFWSTLRRLRYWLRQQRPDLVQTFLFHANVLGTLAALWEKVPQRILGIRVADPTRWRVRMERCVARYAQRVVCVSQEVADFAEQRGFAKTKLVVIANGIDLALYRAAAPTDLGQFGIGQGRKAILYVGRLHRQKGLDWLIELVPQLTAELPDHDLLLVGSGPQRQQLEVRAQQLGIPERVHFAGWRRDIPGIMRAVDLLVLPSRWEGMPNVLLEAMASRLSLITTKTAGVAEILGPLCPSQAVEQECREEFLSKVVAICRDDELREHLGQANRERVEQEFTLIGAIAKYQTLYELLLSESR